MSTVPPPGALPRKYRPSAWWFALGVGLIVAAVLAAVALFVWTLSSFLDTQARILADGQAQLVSVEQDSELMLWGDQAGGQSCSIVDSATGEQVERRSTGGRFERSDSNGDFQGLWRFETGSGELEVTCQGGGPVLLGATPAFGSFMLGLLLIFVVPGALGLAGVASLITTGILWSLREPRPRSA